MLYYKRLIVAKMYAEGDKESIEKKNNDMEYLLKEAFFFRCKWLIRIYIYPL